MRSARTTTYILILASSLLMAGAALTMAGCGGDTSAEVLARVADAQPFVASAMVAPRPQAEATETLVGDVRQVRNGGASYDVEATDPRLSGTFDVVFNYDENADNSAQMWGTWTAANDKGAWVCDSFEGGFDSAGHYFTVGIGKGTGDYEGLLSVWQWYWPLSAISPNTGLPVDMRLPIFAVSGWIQKAE